MHIAIDARLNAYRTGGIPQYTRQLLSALAELAPEEQISSLQHRDHLRPLVVAPNVARRTILTPPHHRLEPWSLPLELLRLRPDVLHCPDFIAPLRRPCPAVVTIHDLAFKHYPEILDDAARAYYGQVNRSAARADGIIAVSEATRQDIVQFLDIPVEEVAVIHEAAAPLYEQLELRPGEARVLNRTPVAAGSFMLFVSTLEPRKNLPTLLQALRICLDRWPDRGYFLVIAGARGWRDDQIFETVRDLRLGDHVLFAGSVGQYDLRWLYNACRMYINPSLYEGFGLPLLEAMACGAACLAAATSSLPEIGGEAVVYVPPLDAGLWADAIEDLWDDEDRQRELGRRGLRRAQGFSWMRAARETLKVYARAAERGRPATAAPTPLRALPAPAPTPSADDARACLRCGEPLLAGRPVRDLAFELAAPDARPLTPRLWACPRCGHVELVVEQPAALLLAPEQEAPASPSEAEAPAREVAGPPSEAEAPAREVAGPVAPPAEDQRPPAGDQPPPAPAHLDGAHDGHVRNGEASAYSAPLPPEQLTAPPSTDDSSAPATRPRQPRAKRRRS